MTCYAAIAPPTFISFTSTCEEGAFCSTVSSSTFASCPVDATMYIKSCVTSVCNGKQRSTEQYLSSLEEI